MDEITIEDILMLQVIKEKTPMNIRFDAEFEKNLKKYLRTGQKFGPLNPQGNKKEQKVKEIVIRDSDDDEENDGIKRKHSFPRYSIEDARISVVPIEFEREIEDGEDEVSEERFIARE